MKAIRVHEFGAPDVMRLEELPDPVPGAGELAIRVEAAGVNPVETYIRSGGYANAPSLPFTPGADAAGTVETVGDGIRTFRPGDRVYTWGSITGTYASKVLCREEQVHPLPSRVTFEQGAGVGVPCGAAWRALFRQGSAQPGETVLVHGATGAVGIACVQLARAAGLAVIGTAGSDRGRLLAQDNGAHYVVGHGDYERIREITDGRGPDLIMEMRADANLQEDLKVLARCGRVVVIGSRGTIEMDPRLAMRSELSIIGMILYNALPEEIARMHRALVAALELGSLRPVIRERIPLADAPRAHHLVMGPGAYGKIVLVP